MGSSSDDEDDGGVAVDPTQNPLSSTGINSPTTGDPAQSPRKGDVDTSLYETFPTQRPKDGSASPQAARPTAVASHADPLAGSASMARFSEASPEATPVGGANDRTRGVSIFAGSTRASMEGPPTNASIMSSNTSVATNRGSQQPASPQPQIERRTITMEFGDEYTGEVVKMPNTNYFVPHGQGTLHSLTGGHSYVGDFKFRLREGYGKLVTNDFFLWCKWKDNRPDWSSSVRIDYTNGEKYCGYLAAVTDPQLQAKVKKDKIPLSKFSHWVRTTVLVRERWGEMVFADGSRYFGQWESNSPDGFGCAHLANGDRYIGNWWKGKYHGAGTLFSSKQSKRLTGGGLVYDGIWEKGVFDAEEGHVTFPCRTRLTGEWKNSVQAATASIHHPTKAECGIRWLNSFQWETLLCGCNEGAKNRDIAAAIPLRNQLLKASSKEEVESISRQVIKENASVTNSLKIFRRCFYFLYGTCGSSGEIGAGLGNNRLGWCYVRSCFGGCIHRGHGKPIESSDIDGALGDVSSFVSSLRRWVDELVGEQGSQVIYDWDADVTICRHLLDIVLADVHQPLFNLYVQVYRKEQVALTASVRRLSGITPDDLGVLFGRHGDEEKLFSPYEDAIRSLQALSKSYSLNAKLNCLKKMSADIDLSTRLGQMKLEGDQLTRLSTFVKNRRESTGESLAHMSITSREQGGEAEAMAPLISQALSVQSGSTDDLLPIHQYVLLEAAVPYLYSHVQLLLDLSADERFIDGTSQDAFCITTLQACTTIMPQLHKNIRDKQKVITPLTAYEKRVEDSLSFDTEEALTAVLLWLPSVFATMGSVSLPLTRGVDNVVCLPVMDAEDPENEDDVETHVIPVSSIVPSLLKENTQGEDVDKAPTIRQRLANMRHRRVIKDRALIAKYIKDGISVMLAADISVFIEVEVDGKRKLKSLHKATHDALQSIDCVEKLYVVPPPLSASICVDLAHFLARLN